MSTLIHPTAIVEPGAELDENVEVGAYAFIGHCAKIGAGSHIAHHATVEGCTELGRDNQIFPYAYIGAKTHDLKFDGGNPRLKIGDRNMSPSIVRPMTRSIPFWAMTLTF